MADDSNDLTGQDTTVTDQDQGNDAKESQDSAADKAGQDDQGDLLIDTENNDDGTLEPGDDDQDDQEGEKDQDADDQGEDKKPAKVEGVPESPDGYQINLDPSIPQDEAVTKAFRFVAHEMGLTNEQVQKLSDFEAGRLRDAMKLHSQRVKAATKVADQALRQKWGDQYETKAAAAVMGYRRFGNDALDQLMNETEVAGPEGTKIPLGNHPVMLEAFSRIGSAIDEDIFVPGEEPPPELPRTISGDPDFTADDY